MKFIFKGHEIGLDEIESISFEVDDNSRSLILNVQRALRDFDLPVALKMEALNGDIEIKPHLDIDSIQLHISSYCVYWEINIGDKLYFTKNISTGKYLNIKCPIF